MVASGPQPLQPEPHDSAAGATQCAQTVAKKYSSSLCLHSCSTVIVDFCCFGKPWRTSTQFLGSNIDLEYLSRCRCLEDPPGLCRRASLLHQQLSGSNEWLMREEAMLRSKMVPRDVRSAQWCLEYLGAEGVDFEGLSRVNLGAGVTSEHYQLMVQLKQLPL